MNTNIIELNNIHKTYAKSKQKVEALKGIDLSVKKGEFIAIMGESGAGKSTLLNILGLLDSQTSGNYELLGKRVEEYGNSEKASLRNEIFGFVMQEFALIDHYTVFENVEIPLMYSKKFGKTSTKERRKMVAECLDKVGIQDKLDVKSNKLSGGQRQRVAITRALINEPSIIIADEPTGALDERTADEIMKILRTINEEKNITVLIITHDSRVAALCDRTYQIADGRIS